MVSIRALPKSPLGPRTILFLNIKLCCSSVRGVWVNIAGLLSLTHREREDITLSTVWPTMLSSDGASVGNFYQLKVD